MICLRRFGRGVLIPCRGLHRDVRLHSEAAAPSDERELWRVDKRNPFLEIPEAWVTDLSNVENTYKGIVHLHPDVFRVAPRLDLLHRNTAWQENYRNLVLTKMLSKGEMPGGGAKPWPQKRVGRHHAGSIRSPHFIRGGFAHGLRGPLTKFSMLPTVVRILGLCTALTIKHVQDDLVIVDDFNSLASGDPYFLNDLADTRNWGYSVLFVDLKADDVPLNLIDATEKLPSFTVMPLYGLNCFSIMKYETLVLSRRALDALEERILTHKHATRHPRYRYVDFKQLILAEGEHEEHPLYPPSV